MSFSAFRAVARKASLAAPAARNSRVALRNPAFRKYSTEAPKKTSNTVLFAALGVGVAGGVAWYVYASDSNTAKEAGTALKSGAQSAKVLANFVPTKDDYQKVYNRIAEVMDAASDKNYDDGSYGPVLLRLAWHSSGTYDKDTNTGGSNYATMRFEPEAKHDANAGLQVARDILEAVKKEFPWISYGDLWTLSGVAAIQEMGGPKIPWRPGRIDGFSAQCTPDGRLPDASQGADHIEGCPAVQIFYRMGFNDQEIVALSGAHALGRCHRDRSGFDGPWTFSPTTVSNEYFRLLFDEKWVWKKWDGPKQLEDKKTRSLMMLPFASVVSRLFELGVPTSQWVASEPWVMKNTDEE